METKQIISWLLDKAARAQDHSYARMLNQAANRLKELDERTKHKPAPELMPMGALTYAIACSHCGNRNKDAETCRKCRCEIESGFEVDPLNGWIPVTERLPEEHDNIFAKLYRSEKWEPLMFCKISDEVLAVVKYEDGTRKVKTVHTTDGEWRIIGLFGAKEVTHWMPLPEPPKEVDNG